MTHYLYQNTVNPFYCTLSEMATLSGSCYFVFKLENCETHEPSYFVGSDLSTNTNRYNLINITLTGVSYTNLTASTLYLNAGEYTYTVYESPTQTINVTGNTIEYGKFVVSSTTNANLVRYMNTSGTTKLFLVTI